MIPRLYTAKTTDFTSNGEGLLLGAYDWEIYEEDNGDFTASFKYPCTGRLFNSIKRGAIIKAHANKKYKNQKFRIFSIEPNQDNMDITVQARHKSFDLVYDFMPCELTVMNQSCEYALNKIFANSLFCKNYVGESDIVNAQNFTISYVTPAEAIRGAEGSLADTYGNGSHIVRDNSEVDKIRILANRGSTRDILLSYGKNITGFTGKEDDTDLITRIIPYAKYTPEGGEETIYRPLNYECVDAPNAGDYYGIYFSKEMDFGDKLAENEEPTDDFLKKCCDTYYNDNQCHFPKISYTINFQDMNATTIANTGANKLYDIEIGDSLMVWHKPFNMNTEVRVVATKFDPVTEEYIEIILGDPRSSLAEIINTGTTIIKGEKGDTGEQGTPGSDGDIGDFPDTIPNVPTVTLTSGLATIEITWTFEAKTYYTYEVYASMNKDFKPTAFDKIFEGKASSYLMHAKPNQTWYFYVRGVNTYGNATAFSTVKSISTAKIDDGTVWFEDMAIGEALIGELRLDRGWAGQLDANLLNVKGNLSVTDGNGAKTLYVDSFGNVSIQATNLSIVGKNVATQEYASNASAETLKNAKAYADGVKKSVSSEVSDVRSSVGNLTNDMNGAFKDGVISEAEAKTISERIVQLDKEKTDLDVKYNTIYANVHLIGTPKTNLYSAKVDFNSKHTKLKTDINNGISDKKITDAEKTLIATDTANYNTSLSTLTQRFEEAIDNIALNKATNVVNAQTQEDIFNKLTKNGTIQGITMVNGQLYINGQYINAKNISVTNGDGTRTFKIDSEGNVTLNATSIAIQGKSISTVVNEAVSSSKEVVPTKITTWYYVSTSRTSLAGGTWVTSLTGVSIPTTSYIWTRTITKYSDGTSVTSDAVCITGDKGATGKTGSTGSTGLKGDSIKSTTPQYVMTASKTTVPTSGWGTTFPTWKKGYYIWSRLKIVYTVANSSDVTAYTTPYCDTSWEQVVAIADSKLSPIQDDVFKALTNGGQTQGIFLKNGKIYLNGEYLNLNKALTVGIDGKFVEIEDVEYSVYSGDNKCISLGFRDIEFASGVVTNDTPTLYMGPDGMKLNAGTSYTGRTGRYYGNIGCFNHKNSIESSWTDYYQVPHLIIEYNTKYSNSVTGNGVKSQYRMFANGDIVISPVKNLQIRTHFKDGSMSDGASEQFVAEFYSSDSDWYGSAMKLSALCNFNNVKGLVLADHYYTTDGNGGGIGGTAYSSMVMVKCGKYSDGSVMRTFRPHLDDCMTLGSSNYRFEKIYCGSSTISTSDRRAKDNIEYIGSVQNSRAILSNKYSKEDFVEFIKGISYATYNLKNSTDTDIGFILQDILDTDIARELVLDSSSYKLEEGQDDTILPYMGYKTNNFMNILALALGEALREIDNIKTKIGGTTNE